MPSGPSNDGWCREPSTEAAGGPPPYVEGQVRRRPCSRRYMNHRCTAPSQRDVQTLMARPSATAIVIGQFAVMLAVNGAVVLFRLFPRDAAGLLAALVGGLGLLASVLIVLGHLVWRPAWRKSVLLLSALSIGALSSLAAPELTRLSTGVFFSARAGSLTAMVRELDDYGRIHQLSDGTRHFKSLNGELVAFTPAEVDTSRTPPLLNTLPLSRVLAREGIDSLRYEALRRQLIGMRLIDVVREDEYVAFLHDGMLDNLEGFLYFRHSGRGQTVRPDNHGIGRARSMERVPQGPSGKTHHRAEPRPGDGVGSIGGIVEGARGPARGRPCRRFVGRHLLQW
jgi:hypothetical protein